MNPCRYQYIELEEVAGRNNEDQFAGLTLTVTNRLGIAKTFVFPTNLPNANTAGKHVLIMSASHAAAVPHQDFIVPNRFLPTDGGTIDFAGIDQWTFEAIPRGGKLDRDIDAPPFGIAQSFLGKSAGCCLLHSVMREYYNAELDQYFMSAMEPDIDALESGRMPGWKLTGTLFSAWSTASGDDDAPLTPVPSAVCRYLIPPGSHFYSASAEECDAVAKQYPNFVLEDRGAFYGELPDPQTGDCPAVSAVFGYPVKPLYRLWNNRADNNHRYTTDIAVRYGMVSLGWVSEGYGPDGVAMCVSAR